MIDELGARRARVERLIAQGRRIADPRDPVGIEARARLPEPSRLSPEGVELALSEILETRPSPEELAALVAAAAPFARCHVVLSAHVCTAALRALAVALAAAPSVRVRPSRRDPVVAELLVRGLAGDEAFVGLGASIERVGDVRPEPGELLDVYGADDTIAHYRAAHPAAILRGHGSGAGLAVVGAGVDLGRSAAGIAADVVPFDQRGCLSPRWVLVEGDAARAETLAGRLDAELEALGRRVPRGPLDDPAQAEIAMYRATAEAVGTYRQGRHHGVGLDPAPRALPLPPAARVVHVVPASPSSLDVLLAPWTRLITAIGADDHGPLSSALEARCPGARRSPHGRMQRPPLDGPVDLRA